MQHIATKIFIGASVVFGITGIVMVIIGSEPGDSSSLFRLVLGKTLMTSVFIILPSFALSVASKYLGDK
jgi:hypothetical protein